MPTLDFKGKPFVYSHHLSVPFRELVIEVDKSLAGPDGPSLDDNLIIHGDNLEALKALLPRYAGKVDVIFIDPPYNTGNEGWAYNDNVNSPLMKSWLGETVNRDDLEKHDKWLCMMWPRLQLLHELLAEDGSFWMTLDDNEFHRGKAIVDEVFGEDGFVANIAWQARYSVSSDASISNSHNYVLVYSKAPETWKKLRNEIPRTEKQAKQYSNPDNDPRGPWRAIPWDAPNIRENLSYPIRTPRGSVRYPPAGRCWSRTEDQWKKIVEAGLDYYGKNKDGAPSYKRYLADAGTVVPTTWWPHESSGHTDEASKELAAFGLAVPFSTPKPTRLLDRVLRIATRNDSLILDSFAGSGTTAHSVLRANQLDGGDRRFILVEMEEYADQLTAERIRKVISGYAFTGTQRTELLREKLNWSSLVKSSDLLAKVRELEQSNSGEFDKFVKQIEGAELIVEGETRVVEQTEGLGGTFTFCKLGQPIDLEGFFHGSAAPAWDQVARYVAYTATGQTLDDMPKKPGKDWLAGEVGGHRIHLIYKPDVEFMRSNDAALGMTLAERISKSAEGKPTLVYAAAKFMSQKELSRLGLTFCQLPYAIHRILGDAPDEA
jgi:adenine-specific DNA-methyltransferase